MTMERGGWGQMMGDAERVTISAPTKDGKIEFEEANGRCVVVGCKVHGGGLIKVTITEPVVEGVSWEHPAVLCGTHLAEGLLTIFKPHIEQERMRG